jgi:superfamily I DNA/RNA helicase
VTGSDRWAKCGAAARRARGLLGSAADGSEPVGRALVEALLDRLGYDVLYVEASDNLLAGAWAALFPDGQIAVCDAGLPRARQAFCLAHEIGHALLHVRGTAHPTPAAHDVPLPTPCGAADIESDGNSEGAPSPSGYPLPGEIYNPRQQREREANVFALELLAPPDVVRRLFVHEGLDPSAIAARLELSYAATLNALAGLLQPTRLSEEAGALLQAAGETSPAELSPAQGVRLDQGQRAAATASGAVLVHAGPGSGKTGTLVGRVAYLVGERGIDPGRVLVLTFSNRAAGELRDRLATQIGPAAQAVMVSTIHSFAHDLLRRYAAAAGLSPTFQVLDRTGALVILRRELPKFAGSAKAQGQALPLDRPLRMVKGLLDIVGEAKNAMVDAAEFAARVAALPEPDEAAALQAAFFSWYEDICAARDALDYDDLLLRAVALLRSRHDLRDETHAAYPYLLVDEFQDINEACGALLGELIPPSGLWAVGDPIQAIYRWRGADPQALSRWLEAKSGGAGTVRRMALGVNYRSRGPIVRLCAGVAAAIRGESAADARGTWQPARDPGSGPAPPVVLADAGDEQAEIDGIAREVERGRADGRGYDQHAVLCATNAQADRLAGGLRRRGIPVSRTVAPEDHPAVRAALSVLALAAGEPEALIPLAADDRPDHAVGTQPGTAAERAIGIGRADALELVRAARSKGVGVPKLLARPPAVIAPAHRGATRALAKFLGRLPVAHGKQSSADAGSWMSICMYLFDSPYRAAASALRHGDIEAPRALNALLGSARAYDRQPPELREPSLPAHLRLLLSAGLGLDADRADTGDSVRVMTMHAAKGLEFPIVFVPNLARGRFPARGRQDIRMAEGILQSDQGDDRASDDRCLFFVALSRARDRLVLRYARRYGRRDATPSPILALAESAFALEPPERVTWQGEPEPEQTYKDIATTDQARPIPAPDSMPVEIDHYALETYLQCPKRYYYAHELGLLGTQGHGFAHYHTVLRLALRRIAQSAADLSPTQARKMLDEVWKVPHAGHPHEGLYYERAVEAVLAVVRPTAPTRSKPARSDYGVTHTVTLPSGTVRVEIDRVDHRDDSAAAVRFRSGRPSDEHRRDTGAALYRAVLDSVYGGGSVEQEYLLTGTVDEGSARRSTFQARLDECDKALAGIAAGRFPANKGDHCPDCPFWLICPAG